MSWIISYRRLRLAIGTVCLCVAVAGDSNAQSAAARPDRGIMPVGSYRVSDIETITTTNGNVHLSIPLATLPPIAGGKLGFTISAIYDSKLWDARTEERRQFVMEPIYSARVPQLGQTGGWKIGGRYDITTRLANDDYSAIPIDGDPEFSQPWAKVVFVTPDGATHELRPVDYAPYSGNHEYFYGFYGYNPENTGSAMRYHSFDGSFLWAKIYPSSSSTRWEVYQPDGTKIVQLASGIQRIIDANGNSIKIYTDGENGLTTTHYEDEQTGRQIKIAYHPSGNSLQVLYQTVGGGWSAIDINFGRTTISGKTVKIDGPYCPFNETFWAEVQVVREIIFPQTQPGIPREKFTFAYNSDTTDSRPVYWQPAYSCGEYQVLTNSPSHGMGSLSQMTMPGDAVVNYAYSLDGIEDTDATGDWIAEETIRTKTVIHDGTSDTWTYNINSVGSLVTSPDGSTVSEQFYWKSPAYGFSLGGSHTLAGLVYRTNQSSKVVVERQWARKKFDGANEDGPNSFLVFNPVVAAEYTSLLENGVAVSMSAKTYQHDFNGNVISETVYDWFAPNLVTRDGNGIPTGVPGSATVLRVTNNAYYNDASLASSPNVYAKRSLGGATPLIVNALQQSTTGPAVTQFSYDGQAYGTPPTVGNLTSKSTWNDVDNHWVTTSNTYGSYGNVATSTDARGKVTQYLYDDATHALPNRVVVDPQNGTGTQTTTTVYDYSTGLVTSVADPNGADSTIDYTNQLLGITDPFARPGIQYGASVGGQRQRITTFYEDNLRRVTVATDLNSEDDKLLKTRTTSDMLGRPILVEQTEDGTNYTIYSLRAYGQMGKITYASNPMRYNVSAPTDGWTRVTNDVLGRQVEVASFSGATQPPSSGTNSNWTGSVATSYASNAVTVTDEAGKQRKSLSDALGRLTQLYEDPAVLNYLTGYDYDVLGNLRHVYQGAQTRTFTYDSLSRLRAANNPESGTITFGYDDNGNLTTKTDARSIVATYAYDALDRVTSRVYSDGTPTVTYNYDTATNGKGRLASASSSVSSTNFTTYDAAGRVTAGSQVTDGQTYSFSYGYNVAGSRTSLAYPSGRVITNEYDQAGRLAGVRDQSSGVYYAGAASSDSTNRIQYWAHGAVSVMKLGNALWEHTIFSSRLQPTEIGLGTSGTGTSVVGLTYTYGTTNNNGNLLTASYSGGGLSYTQNFGYDALNRLTTSNENSGSSWSQTNGYDRYGNRWIDLGGGNQSLYFDTATNRITNGGYSYDSSGNLTNDTIHSYAFDAENKIKSVDGASDVYGYDGDGNRVRKNFATGEKVRMVYSGGQLVAEYDLSSGVLLKEYVYGAKGLIATIEPANGTRYTTADHLGSPRVITNSSGEVVSRHDYMPFGDDIGSGIGGRTPGIGFSVGDGIRQKFTSKERDSETGLDYFLARYYSPTQGRFTSPDEFKGGPEELFAEVDPHDPLFYADTAEPQSLNKYQYCLNNPLRYIDPDGHQTAQADALKLGIGITIAAPHPVAKGIGVAIIVGVAVEATVGWDNVAKGAKKAFDWARTGNTAADGSCPGCQSSERMGQALMENSNKSAQNQTGRGSQNPNTAEAAKEGREQHKGFAEKVKAKPGWKSEPTLKDPATGGRVRPDAVTPGGRPVELKPNTRSGRAQGRRQLPGQERATGKKGRVVYYEPKRKKPE